ncbi:uncharacterized protein M6B38_331575 [Iris pallida]|uniref:Methyltransferase n=1 Tax=Iris pallida TaxID=29817 RepID=A0AAX6H4C5_IRIPA|nr:uncharacterized protein M6B38_331575 [Iris pallida]
MWWWWCRSNVLLPNPNRRTLTILFLTSLLCLLSYFLGIYSNSLPNIPSPPHNTLLKWGLCTLPNSSTPPTTTPQTPQIPPQMPLSFLPIHTASSSLPNIPSSSPSPPIPLCPHNFTDYAPCQDPNRERLFPTRNFAHRERHCPDPTEKPRCRVPRPDGYRAHVPWPDSRGRVWFSNVPFKRLTEAKKDQNWVREEGEWLVFPGGGTSFPRGVKQYVKELERLVPIRSGEVRTVLDIGCGVASFGDQLLDYKVLTMSVAPRDSHEAQVQFALERGLPAMLGVLSTFKLPYPSRSFDMGHCARCLIKWAGHGGLYLMEIDRVLRPGGYWVLSGPPINWKNMYRGWQRTTQDLEAEQIGIEDVAKRLCWKKVAEKGIFAVWRKPTNHDHCEKKVKVTKSPPFCEGADPDAAWYVKMESCITPLPKVRAIEDTAGGTLAKWPKRLNDVPPRIISGSMEGLTAETFNQDNQIWSKRVSHYGIYISLGQGGKYRNVMDMNAGLGGFAAAMSKYPLWVMNVVPVGTANNTLGIIYERGLLGTYMDWCEAFSTYPRTYDLIHAHGIFSLYIERCGIADILLEMDRILRPEGVVIIRDHVDIVVKVKSEADRLQWQSRIVHSEMGPHHPEKLLIVDNSLASQVSSK